MISKDILDFIRTLYESGETQESIAKRLNIEQTVVARLLSGKRSTSGLRLETIEKMFPKSFISLDGIHKANSNVRLPENDGKPTRVPVIGMAAAASVNTSIFPIADYADANAEDYQYFSKARQGDFCLVVDGDSMSPWYPHGTRLLCRPNIKPESGKRVIAVLGSGEVVFKVFVDGKKQFALYSINQGGRDYVYDKTDYTAVRAIYAVIESVRNEADLDRAMTESGIHHGWEDKKRDLK